MYEIALKLFTVTPKTELSVLNERQDCRQIHGTLRLLNFIMKNNIEDTSQEVTILLRMLPTTPMTTAEAESCFSALKRVETYLRNTICQDRLNALAMLSIEKKNEKKKITFPTSTAECLK
ncbi:hypothetical protein PR048_019966, partial [Dryococelus australis]